MSGRFPPRRSWPLLAMLVLFGAGVLASGAAAEETETGAPASVDAFPTPLARPLARICIAMGVVSAAGFGLAWWSRRHRGFAAAGGARIEVVATRGIGARHQVVLLDVGGRRLLVGMGGDSIRTLADLSEGEAFSAALERELPGGTQPSELLDTIGQFEGLDA